MSDSGDIPKNQLTSGSSVSLTTWGTNTGGGNGMAHFIDSEFFGGNVGHASIAVTFPADEAGKELVRKYCFNQKTRNILPFERKEQNVMVGNKIQKQDVYTVYFSWWPDNDQTSFSLNNTLNTDNLLERVGVNASKLNPKFTKPDDPNSLNPLEERTYHGTLGSKKMNMGIKETIHMAGLNDEKIDILKLESERSQYQDKLNALYIIETKLSNEKVKLTGSLPKLLEQHIPSWKEMIEKEKEGKITKLSKQDSERLQEEVKKINDELESIIAQIDVKLEHAIEQMTRPEEVKLQAEVESLTEELSYFSKTIQNQMKKEKAGGYSEKAWLEYEINEEKGYVQQANMVVNLGILYPDFNDINNKKVIIEKLFGPPELLNWRDFLPDEYKNITSDQMTQTLYAEIRKNANLARDKSQNRQLELDFERKLLNKNNAFMQGEYERNITKGSPPDNQLFLPVSGINSGQHTKPGLNVEDMLRKMKEIVESEKEFDLAINNCSVTTGGILAAGADPELKSYFKRKAWGGFGTPQEVFNGAVQFQEVVISNKGKKPFLQKVEESNPLNAITWLGGKIATKFVDPDTSIPAKIGLGISAIPVGVLAGTLQIGKALLTPKKSVTNLSQFINYAWDNNSNFLKVLSAPAALLVGAIAIPAGLQVALEKGIVNPVINLTKKSNRSSNIDSNEMPGTPALDQSKLAEVTTLNPKEAIKQLNTLLETDPGVIPVLSKKAQKEVTKHISSLDPSKPKEFAKIQKYEQTVTHIYDRTTSLSSEKSQKIAPEKTNDKEKHHQKSKRNSNEK